MFDEHRDTRKRFQNACDECRRKKIRCNSETMPDKVCSSCLALNIQCTHSKSQQKRGPKPGSTRNAASHSVQVLVAAILEGAQSKSFEVPDDKEVVLKIMVKLATRIKSLERELTAYHRRIKNASQASSPSTTVSSHPSPSATNDESPDDPDEVDNLSTAVARFNLSVPKQTHFGESSNIMIVMAAMEHRKESLSDHFETWKANLSNVRRPRFWEYPSWAVRPTQTFPAYEFPDQSTLHKLVDVYFSEFHIYTPILYRPSFDRSIADNLHLHDPAFGALVLVVCACGSIYAYPQYPPVDIKTSGWHWFKQIPFDKFVFSEVLSLYHMQIYCLSIYYLEQVEISVRPDLIWILSGTAIRLAHGRGIHRRSQQNTKPTVEGELWKRAFWALITVDIGICQFYGRPRATSSQHFDLDPIIECDQEYWETADPNQIFKQPEDKPSLASFWGSLLKLEEIHGLIQETIASGLYSFSIRRPAFGSNTSTAEVEWYQQVVIELDSALNAWVDSVPPHLQWDQPHQNDIFFSQSTFLWSWYYFVQIQVHRKFIPGPGHVSNLPFPSLTICTNAARSSIRVIEAHCRHKIMNFGFYLCVTLLNSALMLAINLWRNVNMNSPHFDIEKEVGEIHKCIDILRLYEQKFVVAGRFIDMINTVISKSNCAPRLSPTPLNSETTVSTPPYTSSEIHNASPEVQGETFIHEQNFNIPLYTSDLGGTNWFDSPPRDVQQESFSENLVAMPCIESFDVQSAGYNPQIFQNPQTSMYSQPLSSSVDSSGERPLWSANLTERDWDTFMAGVDQLFNIPHDPVVGSHPSGATPPFGGF
ncbi:hypothetical protein K435DRAFT_841203 [Dendrothele bispora CBS 962.96]|uniref:Zn(2)-C6 fungal-type domain-containing protein n=1 Tax=Dendrothele bispora (strain CBS 962.96) TaxID=1314807 RepID=A0A4S8LNQ9_DENBC|nr:hypothetical protein K435DRAFT_844652 [Dendrothele bispora CBS 962.96]THU91002.1 hypothetical protein K435DRAFT_841203 [Dendrothele bispora CBS 962.96]